MSIKMYDRNSIPKELHEILGNYVELVISTTENIIMDDEDRYELRQCPLSFLLGIFGENFALFEKIADLNTREIKVVASYIGCHARSIA